MFPSSYFPAGYFAPTYWERTSAVPPPITIAVGGGGYPSGSNEAIPTLVTKPRIVLKPRPAKPEKPAVKTPVPARDTLEEEALLML